MRQRSTHVLRRLIGRPRRVYCYFGHHKAATVTIHRLLKPVCAKLDLNYRAVALPARFDGDLSAFLARSAEAISYTNAEYRYVAELRRSRLNYRGFHVIRDPRDMVVSGYFSHRYSHPAKRWPELAALRERLENLSFERGLLAEIDFMRNLPLTGHPCRPIFSMAEWRYQDPRILELRFEDLAADERSFFMRVFTHLDLFANGLSPEFLDQAVAARSFRTVTGRDRGDQDRRSHLRSGVPHEWRAHFTDEIEAHFKETFPGVVPALGYEPTDDW